MSQAEQIKRQHAGAVSRLSAEAQSFVPGQTLQQLQADEGKITDNELSQLPRYITSCYPFVKEDQGRAQRASGQRQGSGKSHSSNHAGKRLSSSHAQPGMHNFPGVRPTNRANLRANPGPRLAFAPQGPLPPGFVGRGHCPPHLASAAIHGMPPYYPAGYQQLALPHGWMPQTGSFPLEYSAQYGPRLFVPARNNGAGEGTECSTGECTKSSERKTKSPESPSCILRSPFCRCAGIARQPQKKKNDSGGMVSIGIQNESGVQRSGSTSKKKGKPRTLMCMDAAIQTDFSDEIANLTLMERPSLLYRKDRSLTRSWFQQCSQDSSTDSEEVDSDSGYSSPLHRRNQMSNGTHPIPAGMAFLSYPPMAPGQHNPVLIDNKLVTAYSPYMLANQAMHYAYANTHTVPYTDNYGAQMMRAGYRLQVPPGLMHLPPGASAFSGGDATLKSPVKPTPKPEPCKTQQQEVMLEEKPTVPQSPAPRKKRRRSRRKKKKSASDDNDDVDALSDEPVDLHRTLSSSNVSRSSTLENEDALHFEDEAEFPDLMSASGGGAGGSSRGPASVLSYSDILKNQAAAPSSRESSISSTNRCMGATTSGSASGDGRRSNSSKETKTARKRRKRCEMANRAADEELAEITLEQQVLKELSNKSQKQQQLNSDDKEPPKSEPELTPAPAPATAPLPPGKKSKQPMSLSIADMITALEEKRNSEQSIEPVKKVQQSAVTNLLDATAPVKRGKEREVPKPKKPSPLKKVILKEREEKKRLRLLEDTDPSVPVPTGDDPSSDPSDPAEAAAETRLPDDSDFSQEASGSHGSSEYGNGTPASAEMSPISQTSPISMSPLSGSPLSSGINSPIAGNVATGSMDKSVLMKIHSRRYREYCNQVLDKEIDVVCTQLLQDLVHFHDRLFHKDPSKAKKKRRIVLGLREVTKHLRLKKIKCVIISPNLERIQSKGGLDEALNTIIQLCTEEPVPFVFALGRRALGRACAKLVPVSVVGIFNYEGTEEQYHKLMELTEAGRQAYTNMVSMLKTELADNPKPSGAVSGNVGGFQQLFPHLGHSRTPSACSAISFTSSILSEPISENYPQSEPETDSRGYEIVRPNTAQSKTQDVVSTPASGATTEVTMNGDICDDDLNGRSESPGSSKDGKITIVEMLDEIDEGHEADTEDDLTTSQGQGRTSKVKAAEAELVPELPHIDSIHSAIGDLSAEILSQHSSKTLDLNAAEVQSTHSSRTLEGVTAAAGHTVPDKMSVRSEPREAAVVSTTSPQQRARTIDKERIESWVAETQKQIERIDIHKEADISYHDDDNGVTTANDDDDLTVGSDTDELASSAEDMKER